MRYYFAFFIILFTDTLSFAQKHTEYRYKSRFLGIPEYPCHLEATGTEHESYESWDLTYNRIELTLNPAIFYVTGTVYFEFTALSNGLSSVTIDLTDQLTVNSVKSNNTNLTYTHQDNKLVISYTDTLNANEQGNFTIEYEGEPASTGYGSFVQNFHGDSIPALSTLSEPYGAKDWWPCKQSLADKIDSLDVIVKSPSEYTTASNGLLVENEISNGIRTCHWKHRHPIATYLVFVSTTEYEIYSDWATLDDGQQVEILNYVYPSSYENATANTPITADLIELYSSLLIDYPFKNEKYGHAQFPWNGGMEHQTMSSMGKFYASLIAHELAHQWFGDYITCGSWHEIWLNEGFATFMTGLYYQYLNSEEWYNWKETIIERVVAESGGSVYVDDTTSISRIFNSRLSYSKGAFVLHMLRGQLGDSVFFEGLKEYLNDGRVINGFATTDILREDLELTADTTLNEFFNDWIYGEGYPVYNIECYTTNQKLTIEIKQSPSVTDGPFFEMNIPVSIYYNGVRKIIWVPNRTDDDYLEYEIGYQPDSVFIDEDLWLLGTFNNSVYNVSQFADEEFNIYVDQENKILFINAPDETPEDYAIYNLNGQLFENGVWTNSNQELSISGYPKGIYLLKLTCESKIASAKFVVQ